MGSPVTKERHERRIAQKTRHIKRQVKIAKAHRVEVDEPHKFAKHNAMDCGVPECPMCSNPRHNKFVKAKLTAQELRFIDSGKIDYD